MLPIVKRIALRIREHLPAHVEMDDLYADGVVGLVDAVAKFDVSKQVKLESYARHRVRGAILDGLRTADPATQAQEPTAHQHPAGHGPSLKKTHSERDWRWATRQLGRGESVDTLVRKLEQSRQDKPNPGYYARLTVTRAYARYALSRGTDPQEIIRTISAHPPRATEDGEAYARKTVSDTQRTINSQRPHAQAHAEPPQGNAQRLALRITP
jgi:RNA polymerase sigma factor (sigma-70 family)